MEASAWTLTLEEFRRRIDSGEPLPAGVAISAVNASFALALIAKIFDIAGRRKNFSDENRARAAAQRDAARAESARLTQFADDDVRAFDEYLASVRAGENQAIAAAAKRAIDVPMNGARTAVRGLELCAAAVEMLSGSIAADIGIAAALLSGAVRGMLISVDSNLTHMRLEERSADLIRSEERELREKAIRLEQEAANAVRALPGLT